MKTEVSQQKNGQVELTISVGEEFLKDVKRSVMNELRPKVKAEGFREGKAPDKVVEQKLGSEYVKSEVLNASMNRAYSMAVNQEKLEVVSQPEVNVTKFVPYSDLEFKANVEVMPEVKVPDYSKFKIKKDSKDISGKDVEEVIENLRLRTAETKEVKRAAKEGDKAWIDFSGVRADDGTEVGGASGENYPLILGSNTFIKGFEPKVVGMKPGDEKTFTVTFPKDYHVAALQNEKIKFTVKLTKLEEVNKPEVNDAFAKKAGPFNNLAELKKDIERQLEQEQQNRADSEHRQMVMDKLIDKTDITVPPKLLDRVKSEMRQEILQNLQYRGLTFEQYLEREGLSEEEFEKTQLQNQAIKRAKSSIILTKIAEQEEITVPREELDMRLQMLKQQYNDPKISGELDGPEARRELAAQMLTEKAIAHVVSKATA